jgi:Uma2 family endonuclease
VTNVVGELRQQLRTRDCNIYASDLRVCVSQAGLYAYPDIVVTCGEEKFLDGTLDTLLNPAMIVEVLSESTKKYDRGQKFESYRAASSLSEYLTVAQDKVHVEHYTREPDGGWSLTEYSDAASRMRLESIGVELQLSDLYEKVEFA